MLINNKEISLNDAIKFSDYEGLLLKRRENGLLLNDYQVSILSRNGIDYRKFSNVRDLMFEIESCLDDDFDEELDIVSSQLAEYIYYNETKK
jgi:hypothetical protein